MSATLEKVIQEAKELNPDELRQLRALVDSLLSESEPTMTEDEFEDYLAAKGVIAPVNRSDETTGEFDQYQPVEVSGKPLSEMIIEERR